MCVDKTLITTCLFSPKDYLTNFSFNSHQLIILIKRYITSWRFIFGKNQTFRVRGEWLPPGSIPRRAGWGCWEIGRVALASSCWIPLAVMWPVRPVGICYMTQGLPRRELSTDTARHFKPGWMKLLPAGRWLCLTACAPQGWSLGSFLLRGF